MGQPPQAENLFAQFRAVIRRIPKGKVMTYGDVARAAGKPGYARQVAWALHVSGEKLPWHRVLGSGGKILLTGEPALEQRTRLALEGIEFRGAKVDVKKFGIQL